MPLPHDVHAELHENISHVPLISEHIGRRALANFEEYDRTKNPNLAIDNLRRSIYEASKHPRADPIEKEIAFLACYSLEIQKPFFEDDSITYIDLS